MNKKTSAKTKIIIWSVVLGLVVFLFISINIFRGLTRFYPTGSSFKETGKSWKEGQTLVKEEKITEDIKDVRIDWITGDVTIHKTDKKEIQIMQRASDNIDKDRLFSVNVSGDSLSIQDQNKNRFFFFFNWPKRSSLEVYLPEKVYDSFYFSGASTDFYSDAIEGERLAIDSTSGNVEINGTFKESLLSITSGEIRSKNLISDSLTVEMTSGNVNLEGSFKDLNLDTTSGNLKVLSTTMLNKLNSESTSGNIKVSIPENEGFTVNLDKTSGDFSSDFSTTQNDDQYVYKNGAAKFDVDITSGNFKLELN